MKQFTTIDWAIFITYAVVIISLWTLGVENQKGTNKKLHRITF